MTDAHLGPGILITVIKHEPDQADRYELNGTAPELAAELTVTSEGPVGALAMCRNYSWVVHNLHCNHQMVIGSILHHYADPERTLGKSIEGLALRTTLVRSRNLC